MKGPMGRMQAYSRQRGTTQLDNLTPRQRRRLGKKARHAHRQRFIRAIKKAESDKSGTVTE